MAEGDEGSELAFAEVFAVESEGFGEDFAVSGDIVNQVEGVVAGQQVLAADWVAAGEAEGGALMLVEGAAFGPDGFDVGRTAEQAVGEYA